MPSCWCNRPSFCPSTRNPRNRISRCFVLARTSTAPATRYREISYSSSRSPTRGWPTTATSNPALRPSRYPRGVARQSRRQAFTRLHLALGIGLSRMPHTRSTGNARACGVAGCPVDSIRPLSVAAAGAPSLREKPAPRKGYAPAAGKPTVHPRACGEHLVEIGDRSARRRFIPAPAGNTRERAFAGIIAVHPRACGEHLDLQPGSMPITGSSPRLRGTRAWRSRSQSSAGSSPRLRGTRPRAVPSVADSAVHPRACGEHGSPRSVRPASSVHPRACGEHASGRAFTANLGPDSPQLWAHPGVKAPSGGTRGDGFAHVISTAMRRFIPAPAGNTRASAPKCRGVFAVHPRACGEHAVLRSYAWRPLTAVHPRACGEHVAASRCTCARTGSSPRLRGTRSRRSAIEPAPVHPRACGEHAVACAARRRGRFIPAPAGNTRRRASQSVSVGSSPRLRGTRDRAERTHLRVTVHPRACGEHAVGADATSRQAGSSPRLRGTRRPALLRLSESGSSPRLRGTLRPGLRCVDAQRFIPAPAGNTHATARSATRCDGSSPRLRGTPDATLHRRQRRFIPAPAGNRN